MSMAYRILCPNSKLLRTCPFFSNFANYQLFATDSSPNSYVTTPSMRKANKKKLDLFYNMMQVPGESQIKVQVFDENRNYLGVMSKSATRKLAFNKELNLVDIGKGELNLYLRDIKIDELSTDLPVCALMNSNDFHDYQRIAKEQRKAEKTPKIATRTLRLTANMGEAHLEAKLKQIKNWIEKKNPVQVFIKGSNDKGNLNAVRVVENKIATCVDGEAVTKTNLQQDGSICMVVTPLSVQDKSAQS